MLEIEVKFFTPDPYPIREKLGNLSSNQTEKVFETNQCYEDKQQNLFKNKSLLRLRKDRCVRLTFKKDPGMDDKAFKIFKEYEVEVSDFDEMQKILKGIGFHPKIQYEKYRETFEMNKVTACLDTLPYGSFIELEGEKDAIKKMADHLGLLWPKRIIVNYLHMFDVLKKQYHLDFDDLTFDDFKSCSADFSKSMVQFETGTA